MLGNEGAGVIEDAGDRSRGGKPRDVHTGPSALMRMDLAIMAAGQARRSGVVPDAIDDVVAASLPVASDGADHVDAGRIKPGMTVLAPGIGGSVGNATYQLARAQGAGKVISTAGSATKAARARELGFEDVIDLTAEGLTDGVRRITAGMASISSSRASAAP